MLQIAYQPLLHLTMDSVQVQRSYVQHASITGCSTYSPLLHVGAVDVVKTYHELMMINPGNPKVSMIASYYDTNLVTYVLWNYSI